MNVYCERAELKESQPWSLHHIRRFDGDAALLLVFPSVCEARLSSTGWSNDPCFGHQRVSQSGLPMIHVGDHRHVPDVGLLVHDGPDLIHWEFHLGEGGGLWCGDWLLKSSIYNQQKFIWCITCVFLTMSATRPNYKQGYSKKETLEMQQRNTSVSFFTIASCQNVLKCPLNEYALICNTSISLVLGTFHVWPFQITKNIKGTIK